MDHDIMLTNFSSEKYGELRLLDTPAVGWDVLAVLFEEVPYSGYVEMPVYVPYSGGGGGTVDTRQCHVNVVRRVPKFLCAHTKDKSIEQRDETIEKLQKTIRERDTAALALTTKIKEDADVIVQLNKDTKLYMDRWTQCGERRAVLEKHVEKAMKALGEVKWREVIGEAK
jgi:hypothetical protein